MSVIEGIYALLYFCLMSVVNVNWNTDTYKDNENRQKCNDQSVARWIMSRHIGTFVLVKDQKCAGRNDLQ